MNLGGWSFWGADQFSSNILKNPGFEGLIDSAIVIPVHADRGTFDDSPSWLARPDGFWEGARYSIRSGLNAGKEGLIVHSSHTNYWGLPSFVVREGDAFPNPGDVVAVVKDTETAPPSQWWYSNNPGNVFQPELNQTRPGSPGTRSLRVISSGNTTATVASYLDSIGVRAGKMLPLGGSWTLSFWVRLDSGNASLNVVLGRQGSSPILSQNIPMSGSWRNVVLTFSGDDNGPVGTVNLLFQVTGSPAGQVLLDDVDLRRTEDANQPFRHEVVSMLGELRPAYLRDWQGQLGDTMANRAAGPFARKSYRYRPGDTSQTDYGYGLRDFLDLCLRLDASPWIIVPPVFNDSDCAGMGDYLSAQSDLTPAREILLEFGNENWNSLFRPAGIPDPRSHGEVSGRCFSEILQHAPRLRLKTVINAQADYPSGAIQFAQQSAVSDIVAIAPYFYYSVPAGLTFNQRISLLFQPNQSNLTTIAAALPALNKELAIYEVNLSTTDGAASADDRLPVVAGIASGAALAGTMLDSLARGARRQCAYSFTGFDFQLTSQPGYVSLWGMARDVGPTQRFRPTALALELLNEAIRGDMVAVHKRGPLDVSVYAFRTARTWAAVFVSASTSDRVVKFQVPPGAGSALHLDRLVSDALDATNEDAAHIRIDRETVPIDDATASFRLPPLSIAVLFLKESEAGRRPAER